MSDPGAESDRESTDSHETADQLRRADYPARPTAAAAGRLRNLSAAAIERRGQAERGQPGYVAWLREQSMLADAYEFAKQFSGQGSMWQNPFANPDPGRRSRRRRSGSPRTRSR